MRREWKRTATAHSATLLALSLPTCALEILGHLTLERSTSSSRLSTELGYRRSWTHVTCKKLSRLALVKRLPAPSAGYTLTMSGLLVSLVSLLLNRVWTFQGMEPARVYSQPDEVIQTVLDLTCKETKDRRLRIGNFLDAAVHQYTDTLPSILGRWNLFNRTGIEKIAKVNLLLSALSNEYLDTDVGRDPTKGHHIEALLLRDFLTLRFFEYHDRQAMARKEWYMRSVPLSVTTMLNTLLLQPRIQKRWFEGICKDPDIRDELLDQLRSRFHHAQTMISWIEKLG